VKAIQRFRRLPARPRAALAVGLLSAVWALYLVLVGRIYISIPGVNLRSNDWRRPALIAVAALLVFAWLRPQAVRDGFGHYGELLATAFRRWRTVDGLLLTVILIVAAIARLWALSFGLPHPAARPDEDAVAALAGNYHRGRFELTSFVYPPLFMLVFAAAMWLVFTRLPVVLARLHVDLRLPELAIPAQRITARVLSATAGIASVWLIYRIGVRLFDRAVALIAAAFLALAFLHVRDSHFGVTDMPMSCMVLIAFLAIVKLSGSGDRRDLVAAGILTGLAVATKYNAAVLGLPAIFAILDDPVRRPLSDRLRRAIVFGLLVVAAFLVVCPYAVINYRQFIADNLFNARHLAEGHGAELGRGWVYHLSTTLRYGLGLPLLVAGVLGLPLIVWKEGRKGVLVALFPIAYYAIAGSGRTVFARHILPIVPFLCLSAGYAVWTLGAWVASALSRPRWRVAITVAVTAAVLLPSAMSVVAFDRLLAREDTRVVARRWIESRFVPGTTIAQLGAPNGRPYAQYEIQYRLSDALSPSRSTVVVIVSSQISGSPNLADFAPWFEREYELQFTRLVAGENDPANVYDLQDEFFVPFAGFHQVQAPGPNLRIFVRRDTTPVLR